MYTNKEKHIKGYQSELEAAAYLTKLGYEIYWPTFTQSACDFVVIRGDELKRVQVKTAYWFKRPTGTSYLQCTVRKGASKTHSEYSKENCDVIIIVEPETQIWWIDIENLPKNSNVILKKNVATKQRKNYKQYNPDLWKI